MKTFKWAGEANVYSPEIAKAINQLVDNAMNVVGNKGFLYKERDEMQALYDMADEANGRRTEA